MKDVTKMDCTLLPCPFCGGRGAVWHKPSGMYQAHCLENGCVALPDWPDEYRAIAAWNTRAPAEGKEWGPPLLKAHMRSFAAGLALGKQTAGTDDASCRDPNHLSTLNAQRATIERMAEALREARRELRCYARSGMGWAQTGVLNAIDSIDAALEKKP